MLGWVNLKPCIWVCIAAELVSLPALYCPYPQGQLSQRPLLLQAHMAFGSTMGLDITMASGGRAGSSCEAVAHYSQVSSCGSLHITQNTPFLSHLSLTNLLLIETLNLPLAVLASTLRWPLKNFF